MYELYRITSGFVERISPINGKKELHTGIDLVKLAGGKNAPIESFTDGVVTTVYSDKEAPSGTGFGGFGCLVTVKDRAGATHLYAHLQKGSVKVKVGDHVVAGQVLGKQGRTGLSTGEHLHYEVRLQGYGTHTDPTKYLEKYFSGDISLTEALFRLVVRKVIISPEYWTANAKAGKTVNGEFAALLIKRFAKELK